MVDTGKPGYDDGRTARRTHASPTDSETSTFRQPSPCKSLLAAGPASIENPADEKDQRSSAFESALARGDHSDRGGNDTQLVCSTEVPACIAQWDDDVTEQDTRSEDASVAELVGLDTPEARGIAMKGTVEDWATESLLTARVAYPVPGTNDRIKPGQKLGRAYFDANLPVVRRQL